MWGWYIVTLAGARLKASVRFLPLRGMYQIGGTCKGCDTPTLTTLSLSKRKNTSENITKAESKCGRRGRKGWLICLSDPAVPGMFSSVPTVATFPIRSRAKFPESLSANRNQSVTSGFPLGFFPFNSSLGPETGSGPYPSFHAFFKSSLLIP